jgi:phage-related minor tail protein
VSLVLSICLVCGLSNLSATPSQTGSQNAKTQQSTANKNAILLADTDDTCHLFIDDEDKGQITADTSRKFTVGIGEHILKCKNDTIPDLVWRTVVDVKDTTQVAAMVSLKSLHIQYEQAVTKAQNQKAESDATGAKQLAEAQAEERQREADNVTALQQAALEQISGCAGIL